MPFRLESPAFPQGGRIPARHTRDGDNLSPMLEWYDPPEGTKSLVLIVDDPDDPAGTVDHWAVYDLTAGREQLAEGVPSAGSGSGFAQAVNDFGNARYDGPYPRTDGPHRYRFRLLALDIPQLPISGAASVEQVWALAKLHTLGEAELIGVYED